MSNLLSRRNLLLLLVIGVVGFGTVHIVHGSGSKQHHHACKTQLAKKQSRGSSKTSGKHASSAAKACKPTGKHRLAHHVVAKPNRSPHRVIRAKRNPLRKYARRLIPVLDRAQNIFSNNASTISSGSFDDLTQSCGVLGTQMQVLESQVDGVPHPGGWNSPVTNLHYQIMGIFHQMLGATIACQTSAGNQDSGGLYAAQSDASGAASDLQSTDAHVHSLAR